MQPKFKEIINIRLKWNYGDLGNSVERRKKKQRLLTNVSVRSDMKTFYLGTRDMPIYNPELIRK